MGCPGVQGARHCAAVWPAVQVHGEVPLSHQRHGDQDKESGQSMMRVVMLHLFETAQGKVCPLQAASAGMDKGIQHSD